MHSCSPMYERVATHIRDAVADGRLRPGDRLPSLPELSAQFCCSYAPVRQALTALANEGVVQPRQGAGVFVRERTRAKVIGAIVHNVRNPDHAHLVDQISAAAQQLDYAVMLCTPFAQTGSYDRAAQIEMDFIEKMAAMKGAGIVKCPTGAVEKEKQYRQRIRRAGIPFVIVNDYWTDCRDVHHVFCDRHVGLELAVGHLAERGHRHIAFHTTTGDVEPSALEAFREVTRDRALAGEVIIGLGLDVLHTVQSSRQTPSPITAVICLFEEQAWPVLETFRGAEIAVPDDVSVMALSGMREGLSHPADLTRVEPQMQLMVQSALKLLLEGGPGVVTHQRVPPLLHVGKTSGPCAAGALAVEVRSM